jgi:tetratricopeptide (TPR) repeat protein
VKWTVAIVAVVVGVTGLCRADVARGDFDGRCFAHDGVSSDQRLESCTAVIQSPGQTRLTLAVAYGNRGAAYYNQGQHDLAIADLDEAIRLDPKLATAYGIRGFAYNSKGQRDRAIADLDEAIRLDPNNARLHHSRRRLLQQGPA